jgi:hypothetical protein
VPDEVVDAIALIGPEDHRNAWILSYFEPGGGRCEDRAVGAHQLDAHVVAEVTFFGTCSRKSPISSGMRLHSDDP